MEEYLSEKEQWEAIKRLAAGERPVDHRRGRGRRGGDLRAGAGTRSAIDQRRHAGQRQVRADGCRPSSAVTARQALVRLGELERDYPASPYVDQARLMAARVYVDIGDLDKAASELQAVAEHSQGHGAAHDRATAARARADRAEEAGCALATLNESAGRRVRIALSRGAAAMRCTPKGDHAARAEGIHERQGRVSSAQSRRRDELDLKIDDLSDLGCNQQRRRSDTGRTRPAAASASHRGGTETNADATLEVITCI